MAKKTNSPEVVGNFDALSDSKYVDTLTATSSNASEDAGKAPEGTGDAEADSILATINNREKAAKEEEEKKTVTEDVNEEEQEEKEEEAEESDKEEEGAKDEEKEEELIIDDAKKAKNKKEATDTTVDDDDTKELSFDIENSSEAPITEENGWKDVAKEALGIELENDDFDSFKEKIKEHTEYNLAKFKPETQRLIKFTEAGGSVDDFLEPLSKIDSALILPDADLVDRHLEATGWKDAEKRQAKIEAMAESGELEVIGTQARESLKAFRKEEMDRIISDRLKAQEKFEQRAANAPKEEAKAIKSQLESMKEFMGTKLSADNIEKIVKNYETGKYHDAMKNTEDIAAFALWKEFGKMGEKNLMIKAQRELKDKHKAYFHKVPPKLGGGTAGTKKATSSGQDPEGNWDELEKTRG